MTEVYYSCESFYDRDDGRTPRVTSICVRNFASGQTSSFSIHKIAELKKISNEEIQEKYDILEKEMLKEFFEYMQTYKNHIWIHWNMRDINYGFQALEHRFRILKGTPISLEESKKFDLSRALVALYGNAYISHPRLQKLMELNHITAQDFLTGSEEAKAFEEKEFVKLHQSTLRKADVLANILGRTLDNSLKTNANWRERHGLSWRLILDLFFKHWIKATLATVGLISAIITIIQFV
ncbi:hypothetical protein [Acinetobacter sp.]|uniref:hypothetical protein n=1 Tax=Acinetobacter sp. TaxID=472 RepID=UPI0035B07C37